MTNRLIVLSDLDDTWFSTHRAEPTEDKRLHLAAVDRQGAPLCFQTAQQNALWKLIERTADIIIPVTGRTSYAVERVTLLARGGYTIASHGALVTLDGTIVPAWAEHLAPHLDEAKTALEQARNHLEPLVARLAPGGDIHLRVLHDLDVPVYLSVKSCAELPERLVAALREASARFGLRLHANARNAALRPHYTCKASAVRFVLEQLLERHPEDTVLTFGDSLSDIDFMGTGDMAVAPTNSQIWRQLQEFAQ